MKPDSRRVTCQVSFSEDLRPDGQKTNIAEVVGAYQCAYHVVCQSYSKRTGKVKLSPSPHSSSKASKKFLLNGLRTCLTDFVAKPLGWHAVTGAMRLAERQRINSHANHGRGC